MKNFVKLIFVFILIFSFWSTFADNSATNSSNSSKQIQKLTVNVTEKIPGAGCTGEAGSSSGVTCSIEPGLKPLTGIISKVLKAFTAIALLAGVLFIVINGIMLSMGGLDSGSKDNAKKGIFKAIAGLILLLLSGTLLAIFFPWIYK